jgi:hypothetical protein
MKVKHHGIEWGAAYEEARPMTVTDMNGDKVLIYSREGYGINIEIEGGFRITRNGDKFVIEVDNQG